ncbi:MAG: hypothetical protein HYU66_02360 [Armatimonadetes bacterium]|nr:hypothetical protein [Armatimonadota bacterium]
MCRPALLLALLLLPALGAALEVSSGTVELTVTDGVVTRLRNKLTGETLDAPRRSDLHGLWRKDGPGRFSWHGDGTTATAGGARTANAAGEAVSQFHAEGDLVVVTHQCTSAQPGLQAVQWGLVAPVSATLYFPGWSGQQFDADTPDFSARMEYPLQWECGFVLLGTPQGGFLIQATDDAQFYKNLDCRKVGDRFELGFGTEATAPWDRATTAPGTTWWIRAYEGDWTVGAALYRKWAEQAFGLTALARQQPAWVKDIGCVVINDFRPALLQALAARLDPKKTLIYVPSWRVDSYDRNYPDYTPQDGFVEQVKHAHDLGFRVMVHCNYFGCQEENPAYQQVQPYHVRRPWDGQLDYWLWERADPIIKFAYIDPASKAWRDLLTARMTELVQRTGIDAVHLDQTLCIFNDHNGLVDGMNMMQGSLALHRQLREALPELALSGEGLDEITCRYEAFAQRHLRGLNHTDSSYDMRLVNLSHAVSSAVLRPYTGIYGYLGFCSPRQTELFLAWRAGYEHFGVIPTLAWVGPDELRDGGLAVEDALRRAKLEQERGLVPVFDGYGPATLAAYRAADGERFEWRRESYGTSLSGAGGEVVSRRLYGAAEVRLPGSVAGGIAYDAERVFGLDPTLSYLLSPIPRDLTAPHVAFASQPVQIGGLLRPGEVSLLSLRDTAATVRLGELTTGVRSGVRLRDGVVRTQPGLSCSDPSGSAVAVRSDGIFAHPPWKGDGVGPAQGPQLDGLGHTMIEAELSLPTAPRRFASLCGVDGKADEKQCDGVTFIVTATAGEETLTARQHVPWGPPQPLTLDLAALAGKQITLRLETTPGPAGNISFDWALWRDARVEPGAPVPVELTLAAPEGWSEVVTAQGSAPLRLGGDGLASLTVPAPGRAFLLPRAPAVVAAGTRLAALPFSVVTLDPQGRAAAPTGYAGCRPGAGTVGGVERPGLGQHPPQHGQTIALFACKLPDAPLKLVGEYGIRDGNQSEGVGFRVELTGERVWGADLPGGAMQWQPFAVDLSAQRGRTAVLGLVVDSLGTWEFDWAQWAEPRFEPAG